MRHRLVQTAGVAAATSARGMLCCWRQHSQDYGRTMEHMVHLYGIAAHGQVGWLCINSA